MGFGDIRCSLINIYAPNTDSPDFFVDLCNTVKQIGNTYVILGGDSNQVRNPVLDKSNFSNTSTTQKSQLAIDVLEEELGLDDISRLLHHQEREYSFYSNPHSSYSRIDYFLVSKQLVDKTVFASIGNIMSDHAPVEMAVRLSLGSKDFTCSWRFNTSLQ